MAEILSFRGTSYLRTRMCLVLITFKHCNLPMSSVMRTDFVTMTMLGIGSIVPTGLTVYGPL